MLKGEKKNPVPKNKRKTLWCKECEQFLPVNNFNRDGRTSAGTQKFKSRCKKCEREHNVRKHPSLSRYKILKEYVDNVKERCVVCGYDRLKKALEFHHLDTKQKDNEISNLLWQQASIELIQKEIDKCVVVCNRCHREIHAGLVEITQ